MKIELTGEDIHNALNRYLRETINQNIVLIGYKINWTKKSKDTKGYKAEVDVRLKKSGSEAPAE
jgi:hypothetical protein